jgi:hypothetical protein
VFLPAELRHCPICNDPSVQDGDATGRRLDDLLRSVDERLDALEAAAPDEPEPVVRAAGADETPMSHVLFVPSPSGYLLIERAGPPPSPGEVVAGDAGSYAVSKVVRSPLPGDARLCAYLSPV